MAASHYNGLVFRTPLEARWAALGGAALGEGPDVSYWQISHGSGAGVEDMYFRVNDATQLWEEAAKKVG